MKKLNVFLSYHIVDRVKHFTVILAVVIFFLLLLIVSNCFDIVRVVHTVSDINHIIYGFVVVLFFI